MQNYASVMRKLDPPLVEVEPPPPHPAALIARVVIMLRTTATPKSSELHCKVVPLAARASEESARCSGRTRNDARCTTTRAPHDCKKDTPDVVRQ